MINFKDMKNDILSKDYKDIFNKYLSLFKEKVNLPTTKVTIGTSFFRGRDNCDTFKVSFDDYDTDIRVPYFKKEIEAPPIQYASGGRFNKKGISYLYMTSDFETSMSEIRLNLDEVCSIGEFKCIKDSNYVDLSKFKKELEELKQILMQPVKDDSSEIYKVTQFVSYIFKELEYDGIIYESTRSSGKNIVSFYPEFFEFQMYSEKAYKGEEVNGSIVAKSVMDEFKKYPNYRKEMYAFDEENPDKEEEFEYIQDKIIYEDKQNFKQRVNKINNSSCDMMEKLFDELVKDFEQTFLKKYAYQLRGSYYINNNNLEKGINDFILSFNFSLGFRDRAFELVEKDIFENNEINQEYKNTALEKMIREQCELYFDGLKKGIDKLIMDIEDFLGMKSKE